MKKMQWKAIPVWAGMACMLLSACDDDAKPDAQMPDYVIFGDYYGECGGNSCVDLYKIEGEKVYEDSKDSYPGSTVYSGQFTLRGDISFDQAKSVIDKFPEKLFDETEIILGMPDAADWGGYYVEISRNNARRFWLIDKHSFDGSDYLNDFKAEMEAKLTFFEKNSNQ
jgi:hypothetical protein